jgi:hypothetical protein
VNSLCYVIASILHNNSENQQSVEKFQKEIHLKKPIRYELRWILGKRNKIKGLREILVHHPPRGQENQIEISNTDRLPHSPLSFSLCKKKSQSE